MSCTAVVASGVALSGGPLVAMLTVAQGNNGEGWGKSYDNESLRGRTTERGWQTRGIAVSRSRTVTRAMSEETRSMSGRAATGTFWLVASMTAISRSKMPEKTGE